MGDPSTLYPMQWECVPTYCEPTNVSLGDPKRCGGHVIALAVVANIMAAATADIATAINLLAFFLKFILISPFQ